MNLAVYILCGTQFSGKTTLSRAIALQRGWTYVSIDDIAESLLDSSDSEVTEDQWNEAYTSACEQLTASLSRGLSVVHDATNIERVTRDHLRALASQFGASAHVIYMAVPVEEANRRRIANQAQPQRHDVSEAGFLELVSSLEPPSADESVLVFDGTLDIVTWIERYVRD